MNNSSFLVLPDGFNYSKVAGLSYLESCTNRVGAVTGDQDGINLEENNLSLPVNSISETDFHNWKLAVLFSCPLTKKYC